MRDGLWLARAARPIAIAIGLLFAAWGVWSVAPAFGRPATQPLAPTPAPAPLTSPGPAAPLAPTPIPQVITIDTPPPGTPVGSPVVITGRTARWPKNGLLVYRIVNGAGQQLGAGSFPVFGTPGQAGSFNASLVFNVPWDGGPIRVDLFEQGDAAGAVAASASIDLAVEAQYQAIAIDTPPPGTIVGSPMVLTGRTARAPRDNLTYRVFSSAGQSIGEGSFPVFGAPGSPRDFAAELFFDYSLNGDTIRAELYDWNAATGTADTAAAITLVVLPAAQRITIDTPPPGTLVGSPVVISGRTTRYPFQGDLSYRVTDAAGQQLGVGTFAVAGPVDQAASFNASPTFNIPRDGGTVHLEVFDVNPADGSIPASSTLDLDVLAQYQRITIDTPPSGTTVGSPVVITGQASRYPNHGQLSYRVVDAGGAALGTGSFPVDGAQGERGSFVASLTFAEPPDGGNIRLELRDQADDGSLIASTPLDMVVAPPPPQQIAIDTPAPGTTVGSPVVITGQTTRAPASGQLGYRVRDASGRAIGAGAFPVSPTTGRATSFNASITFVEPRGGGPIAVDIFDQSGAGGTTIASASIDLYVAPQP